MTDLADALRAKINDLGAKKDALEEEMGNLDARISVLFQLLKEEDGDTTPAAPKKRGRPRKVASTPVDPETASVLSEAATMEGTDPEVAARLSARKFEPAPRPVQRLGRGITAGAGKGKPNEKVSNADHVVSMPDDVEVPEV